MKTNPPTFPMAGVKAPTRAAALSYAIPTAASPAWAVGSLTWIAPLTVPGGNPVIEVPGHSPTSPVTVVGVEVLVIVAAASTAKLAAAPRGTVVRPVVVPVVNCHE